MEIRHLHISSWKHPIPLAGARCIASQTMFLHAQLRNFVGEKMSPLTSDISELLIWTLVSVMYLRSVNEQSEIFTHSVSFLLTKRASVLEAV